MDSNNYDLKLQKVIGQINFRPTVHSYSHVGEVAQLFESQFQEWKAEEQSNISLYTPKKKRSLQLTVDTITYLDENSDNTEAILKYLGEVFLRYKETSDIKKINRIGFRRINIFESKFKYEELVDLIHKKFYNSDFKLEEGYEPEDVVHVFDLKKGIATAHILIGPVKKEEGFKNYNPIFKIESKLKDSLGDNNLFIDIDVSVKGLNAVNKDIEEEVSSLVNIGNEILDKYSKYISK
jgi:uncharacterized protein (TIGR04255 family)